MSSSFQIISVHSLPLFNFTQWKDKCAYYSFTTTKKTHSMCQVSLVVKYIYQTRICNKFPYYFRNNISKLLTARNPAHTLNIIALEALIIRKLESLFLIKQIREENKKMPQSQTIV